MLAIFRSHCIRNLVSSNYLTSLWIRGALSVDYRISLDFLSCIAAQIYRAARRFCCLIGWEKRGILTSKMNRALLTARWIRVLDWIDFLGFQSSMATCWYYNLIVSDTKDSEVMRFLRQLIATTYCCPPINAQVWANW